MLSPRGQTVTAYGFFTSNKVGKTGISVTCDVRNPSGTLVANNQAATETGGGWFKYAHAVAGGDPIGGYEFTFKTGDTTVDRQHVPALWVVGQSWVEGLVGVVNAVRDAVWAAADRTLTGFGTLAVDAAVAVWGYLGGRTLSSFGFTVGTNPNATETAIAEVTAKLDTMLEFVSGQYRFDSQSLGNVSGALTGDQATKLNQIFAKTALLGTQGVTVVGPHTQEGTLDIIKGFEYTLDSGFAPKWSRDDWPPLAGATVSLVELTSPHTQIATGSVVVAGGEDEMQTIALHMPGDLTTGLTASTKTVLVQAVLDGMTYPVPLLRVEMKVS